MVVGLDPGSFRSRRRLEGVLRRSTSSTSYEGSGDARLDGQPRKRCSAVLSDLGTLMKRMPIKAVV